MLKLTIPGREFYNEITEEFQTVKPTTIVLEHSLVAIAKWEAIYHRSFISDKQPKNAEETLAYIKCMTITQNVDPEAYYGLTANELDLVNKYIANPMTATKFMEVKHKPRQPKTSSESITSELIYYWMIAHNIPFECQKWHIERLLTLIRVCSVKTAASNKKGAMSKSEIAARHRSINAQRRAEAAKRG